MLIMLVLVSERRMMINKRNVKRGDSLRDLFLKGLPRITLSLPRIPLLIVSNQNVQKWVFQMTGSGVLCTLKEYITNIFAVGMLPMFLPDVVNKNHWYEGTIWNLNS